MANKIKLSVPKPCHENWQDMTPEAQGRHCAAGQTKVIDFTSMTDTEVAKTVKHHKNGCGMFLESQLNRELNIRKEKSPAWLAAGAAAITLLSLGSTQMAAQEATKTEQSESKPVTTKETSVTHSKIGLHTIHGTLLYTNGKPADGITVIVKNATDRTTVTDAQGKFSMQIQPDEILHFSGKDLISTNFIVTKNTPNEVIINVNRERPRRMGAFLNSKVWP